MTKRINSPDTESDILLRACLDKSPRASFIMIAGAGSGKTTSLVKALSHIISSQGSAFKLRGQKVACITYTEIAAQEIWHDVENNPLTHVSTIHNFFWTVVRPFQADIKQWVCNKIVSKIDKLVEEAANYGPRVQQRTKDKNARELEKYEALKVSVLKVPEFRYELGSDYSKGILGHGDIIDLVTSLIQQKPLLASIISQKFPYIFVDESQDTFPLIVEAMKKIDSVGGANFCLGFFGDPMQKIYLQGAGEIETEENWVTITKEENFRCSQNVLRLINNIRITGDGLQQTRGRTEIIEGEEIPVEGSSQIFVLPADESRTENLEKVKQWCVKAFNDEDWSDERKIKIFVLVHRMAANRLGFPSLYAAMNDEYQSFSERFADGTAWPLKPFLAFVLPLVDNIRSNNSFAILSLLREYSPLLTKEKIKGADLALILDELKIVVEQLKELMAEDSTATVLDILNILNEKELILLDDRFLSYLSGAPDIDVENENEVLEHNAITAYLKCPAKEFWGYQKYYEDESPFATQQGVKGAQFDRVITILDDDEGRSHRQFSYDKYFGVTDLSDTDKKNIEEGKDNVVARTRRLFYVSCSRARKDLAVVYYSTDVNKAVEAVKALNLFEEGNIHTVEALG